MATIHCRPGDGVRSAARPRVDLDVGKPRAGWASRRELLERALRGLLRYPLGGPTLGEERVMSGGSIELHRLANALEPATRWSGSTGVEFTPYTAWADVRQALSNVAPVPEFTVTDQGGFLEYRSEASCVSVIVVDDEEEERGYHVGHGDIWSVSLWAPVWAN